MNFLDKLKTLLSIVSQVHAAAPTASPASKKEAILAAIDVAARVGEDIPNPTVQGVSTLVETLVNVLHSTNTPQN